MRNKGDGSTVLDDAFVSIVLMSFVLDLVKSQSVSLLAMLGYLQNAKSVRKKEFHLSLPDRNRTMPFKHANSIELTFNFSKVSKTSFVNG